jgi:hypothetical protein
VGVFCFNFVGVAIASWKYFFIAPAVAELLMAACLAMAFAAAGAAV